MSRNTFAVVGVAVLAALAIACSPASTAASHGTASPAAKVGAQGGTPASSAPAAAPKTLLNIAGKGIKKSAVFTTADEWQLTYTYDCASFGGSGNFAVSEYSGDGSLTDIIVNELDKAGGDTVPQHADGGAHYLEINSECKWTVKVTG